MEALVGIFDLNKIIVGVIVSILGTIWFWLAKRYKKIARLAADMDRARIAVGPASKGIWIPESIKPAPPKGYETWLRTSIPIWVIANLKGGVGKTTTATNLFAHYAKKGEPVLFIDLDFQGSGTSMVLGESAYELFLKSQAGGGHSPAAELISGKDGAWLCASAQSAHNLPAGKVVAAYYTLANVENQLMVQWLIGERQDDIRYHLAEILHSDVVQKTFKHIIIDAPPRLTTACVQALCAATHVLIPTVLDRMSAVAVGTFASQLRINQQLWPYLRVIGVLGTLTSKSLNGDEKQALVIAKNALHGALERSEPPLRDAVVLAEKFAIPERPELSRQAGSGVAYASIANNAAAREVRELFDNLAGELDRRSKR